MSSIFIYLQSKTFMLRIRVCTYTRNRQTRAWFGTHFSCFADHKEWKVAKTQEHPLFHEVCVHLPQITSDLTTHFHTFSISMLCSRTGAALTPLSALRGWHLVMRHLRGLCKNISSHQFSPVCAPGKLVPTGHGMPKVCSRGVCDGSHWTRLLQQWIWLSVKSEDMNNRL